LVILLSTTPTFAAISSVLFNCFSGNRVVKEWEDFLDAFPTGTAEEYVKQPGAKYSVPFAKLFRPEMGPYEFNQRGSAITNHPTAIGKLPVAVCTASVKWQGFRGMPVYFRI